MFMGLKINFTSFNFGNFIELMVEMWKTPKATVAGRTLSWPQESCLLWYTPYLIHTP